jgi:drug/metabolite transporter (DMT)-like permease
MNEQAGSINNNKRNLILLVAAFAAVYVIWGSTYLGIKYAIQTIPSFLMGGMRFTIAGLFLYFLGRFILPGYEKPKPLHWRTSLIVGALLLAGGNGGVVIAEHYISSSMTALLVATVPFWIVLLNWLVMRGERPNLKVAGGLLIGFLGVWMLIAGRGATTSDAATTVTASQELFGSVLLIAASLSWALGSLYGSRAESVKSPVLGAGMQMLSGGVLMLLIGTVSGEWTAFDITQVSASSWLALAYLIAFGAIVAYTAYSWLLKNSSPAMVSTYAYVNPAIAVFLGWAIAGETLTGQMLLGAAIIVGSVALITSHKKDKKEEVVEENDEINISSAGVNESYST